MDVNVILDPLQGATGWPASWVWLCRWQQGSIHSKIMDPSTLLLQNTPWTDYQNFASQFGNLCRNISRHAARCIWALQTHHIYLQSWIWRIFRAVCEFEPTLSHLTLPSICHIRCGWFAFLAPESSFTYKSTLSVFCSVLSKSPLLYAHWWQALV